MLALHALRKLGLSLFQSPHAFGLVFRRVGRPLLLLLCTMASGRTLWDRFTSLFGLSQEEVFQSDAGGPEATKVLRQALQDQIEYCVAPIYGADYSVSGSLLEYNYTKPVYGTNRSCRVWLDGCGLANPHYAVVHCPVVWRGDKGCDILKVGKRLRLSISMRQGGQDGAVNPRAASDHLARLVTCWEDDPVCSWAPLFERLWAGMYCAVFGADAVNQGDAALGELWPEVTEMPQAVLTLCATEAGMNKILVMQRQDPVPVNFDVFHVLVAVTKVQLGLVADRGGRHYSASSPYDAMPDLFIIGSDARMNGYPTVFSDAAVRQPDSWRAAIHWLLEQGLPGEDCLNGLVMMMRRNVMFISPSVTQVSLPYSDRLVNVDTLRDVVSFRIALMRYRSPEAKYRDQSAGVVAVLTASGLSVAGIAPLGAFTRGEDEGWLVWMMGASLVPADVDQRLAQCSTQMLLALCAWAADDSTWCTTWASGLGDIAHTGRSLPVPGSYRSRADFVIDIRSGGIIKRTDSLPLFNGAVDPLGLACTGLTALYNVSDQRAMAADPGYRLAATLCDIAVSRLMHAILAVSCACRASTEDFCAQPQLGLTYSHESTTQHSTL